MRVMPDTVDPCIRLLLKTKSTSIPKKAYALVVDVKENPAYLGLGVFKALVHERAAFLRAMVCTRFALAVQHSNVSLSNEELAAIVNVSRRHWQHAYVPECAKARYSAALFVFSFHRLPAIHDIKRKLEVSTLETSFRRLMESEQWPMRK